MFLIRLIATTAKVLSRPLAAWLTAATAKLATPAALTGTTAIVAGAAIAFSPLRASPAVLALTFGTPSTAGNLLTGTS